jgi:hypothetical protein
MNRKFKAIGMALVAIFAISAFSAAGAQAISFHSERETTFFQGEQIGTNIFTTTAGNVKCKKATFVGESTGTVVEKEKDYKTETVEVTPTYAECTAFGQAASVTSTKCEYTLNANGTVVSVTGCEGGGVVVHVPSGNCTVTVPDQHFTAAKVEYKNEGVGTTQDVLVTADVTNQITYNVDGPGAICGTPGHYTDGNYTGSVTTKGYKTIAHEPVDHVGIWVK